MSRVFFTTMFTLAFFLVGDPPSLLVLGAVSGILSTSAYRSIMTNYKPPWGKFRPITSLRGENFDQSQASVGNFDQSQASVGNSNQSQVGLEKIPRYTPDVKNMIFARSPLAICPPSLSTFFWTQTHVVLLRFQSFDRQTTHELTDYLCQGKTMSLEAKTDEA